MEAGVWCTGRTFSVGSSAHADRSFATNLCFRVLPFKRQSRRLEPPGACWRLAIGYCQVRHCVWTMSVSCFSVKDWHTSMCIYVLTNSIKNQTVVCGMQQQSGQWTMTQTASFSTLRAWGKLLQHLA